MQISVIHFYGVTIACRFDYLDGSATEPEDTKLREAWVGGENIFSMLTDEQIDELESLCLESYRDMRATA